MLQPYKNECSRIGEASTYSAETHHILAKRQELWYKLFQLGPAIVSALMVTLVVGQVVPGWVGVAATFAAVVTAIGTVMNPQRAYYEHLTAAKAFTVMKHEACELIELGPVLSDPQVEADVRSLHDRYNDLVRIAPPTADWAFEKARKRIKAGVHAPDEKS